MPGDLDTMLARLEVRLDNLEAHVMRELAEIKRRQEEHATRLVYIDKLTAIGRAFTAAAMTLAGLIGWFVSQYQSMRGVR